MYYKPHFQERASSGKGHLQTSVSTGRKADGDQFCTALFLWCLDAPVPDTEEFRSGASFRSREALPGASLNALRQRVQPFLQRKIKFCGGIYVAAQPHEIRNCRLLTEKLGRRIGRATKR